MEKANISRAQQFFTILVTCTSPLCKRPCHGVSTNPMSTKAHEPMPGHNGQEAGLRPFDDYAWADRKQRNNTFLNFEPDWEANEIGHIRRGRTPPARLGDKWIGKDKWIGRHPESWTPPAKLGDKRRETVKTHSRRAGHHQPDWATNQLGDWETHDFEERQPGEAGHHQPDWETNQLGDCMGDTWKTCAEPDTVSQTGREMSSGYFFG